MIITEVFWFNEIGIVLGRNEETNEFKAYIGRGDGLSEREDVKKIVEYGSKLNFAILERIVRQLERWDKEYGGENNTGMTEEMLFSAIDFVERKNELYAKLPNEKVRERIKKIAQRIDRLTKRILK